MNHHRGLTKSKDTAVWQYLIDHSVPVKSGYRIFFYIRSRSDFEARVKYRMEGNYRYDERELDEKLKKQCEEYMSLRNRKNSLENELGKQKAFDLKRQKKFDRANKSKNIFTKLVVFLYKKTRDYIYK